MFSYILSFFRNPSSDLDLTLEESCDILKENSEESGDDKISDSKEQDHNIQENHFSTNTGEITDFKGGKYTIDNFYQFDAEDYYFEIGSEVSYHRVSSNGKISIYNVNKITNEWDICPSKESTWSARVIICKVEKRDKRHLTLSPQDISVNLDNVCIEFIPLVGDWLQLDVKCTVDENAIDLSGQVIEVNKILPLRPHIEIAKVTVWDTLEQVGVLNKDIYFNKEALSYGYVPAVGDKVISEVIESDQNRCVWRALKVMPEYIKKKIDDNSGLYKNKIEENHDGLVIDNINLHFSELNETKQFKIKISNVSKENFMLVSVEFVKLSGQCKINDNLETKVEIMPNNFLEINCECTAKNIGVSSEFLLLSFEDFNIGRWVNVNVTLNVNRINKTPYDHRRSYKNYGSNNQLIRGQRQNAPKRFAMVQLPQYAVPQRLLDLMFKYGGGKSLDKANIFEELKIMKPALFTNLGPMNYEEKFHTLLHFDEIANLMCIRNYDQEKACFVVNGEYLMLEIENLSERRPSIVLGDRIIASDPLKISQEEYEGNIHKVGAKHVYLKFSSLFHDKYNGEDYSIRVVPSRSSYRRRHHAVFLVARNLGKDLLFPTRIVEKEPQVDFVYVQYGNTVNESNVANKIMSPKEALRRIKEYKENEGKLKLEWYNKNLNCKQKDAVINILKGVARPLPYIIFGPPGTGKTITIIETILQIVRLIPESRLLVTAPSNSAADLIALRLISSGVLKPGDLVRLVSVNYAAGDMIPAELVPYCATGSFAREGTAEENILAQNGMTFDCSRAVLGRHKITVSTCSSAGTLHCMGFPKGHFTHIIVDEAGQAAEPEVMIPIQFLDKWKGQVVLAGDPMQLGPVILCNIASECGLNESLLERFINRFPYIRDSESFANTEGYDPRLVTKLLYNYRSLNAILQLFSCLFYNGDLIPTIPDTNSDEALLLESLNEVLPTTSNGKVPAVVFHGVDGENYQTADSPSWYNPHEAAQVFYYINEFYRLGLSSKNIGIITPYTKQVKEIKLLLKEAEFDLPKIGTVEDFQGQEFEVILLSTVRSCQEFISNDLEHSLGFVSSPRRLNVAISRARALLIIIGNPNLLCYDTYWRSVIKYCIEKGAYNGCDLNF